MKSQPSPLPVISALTGMIIVLLLLTLIGSRTLELLTVDPSLPPLDKLGAALATILTAKFWIPVVGPLFLIAALAAAAAVFEGLHRGAPFEETVVRGLKRIGLAMIFAGLAGCVLAPFLTAIATGDFGALGLNLNIYDVAVGLIGVALNLIAAKAQRLKAELEQFV